MESETWKEFFSRFTRKLYRWRWSTRYQVWELRFLKIGQSKATVTTKGGYQTFDDRSLMGANANEPKFAKFIEHFEELQYQGKREAFEACIIQKFIK